MTEPRAIVFSKYHGLGNDFIVVADARFDVKRRSRGAEGPLSSASKSYLARLARSICDRHTGVGADGLLILSAAREKGHDARMRVFNADGSEAEMSGNGIRCAAAYLASRDRATRSLHLETAAGVKSIQSVAVRGRSGHAARDRSRNGSWIFRVGMGIPILDPGKIPFDAGEFPAPIIGFPLSTRNGVAQVTQVTVSSVGNPHCSVFVPDFESVNWPELGREIETNPLFPNRTNVEFIRVISRSHVEVRFWERGVGKTQSSGTGSCAAVVACVLHGLTERNVRVRTLAGTLQVAWPEAGPQGQEGEVTLTGPAEVVAEGTYYFRRS